MNWNLEYGKTFLNSFLTQMEAKLKFHPGYSNSFEKS